MKTLYLCLIAAAALGGLSQVAAAAGSNARPADVKYCHALAQKYSLGHPVMQSPNVGMDEAMLKCDSDTAASIATLTRALNDEKIVLPPRG